MTATPLVSVIVPNFNKARILEQCLKALLAQTYAPMEIVFVDDCSTDGSAAIARRLGLDVLSTPVNSGPSGARNLGSARARGAVLFFVDSDVALAPDAVANAVALLESDSGIGAVSGNFAAVPLTTGNLVREHRNLYRYYLFTKAEGADSEFLNSAMVAIPAAVWAEVGPWHPGLLQSEGSDLRDRMVGRYDVWLTPTVHGRHDDDGRLAVALHKVFTRTHRHIPLFLQPRYVAGVVGSRDSYASLAAVLTLGFLLVPPLTGSYWTGALAIPPFVAYLWFDRHVYRFVREKRGLAYTAAFAGVHFLVNLSIAAGAATGIARWLVSGSFRRLYETAPTAGKSQARDLDRAISQKDGEPA